MSDIFELRLGLSSGKILAPRLELLLELLSELGLE